MIAVKPTNLDHAKPMGVHQVVTVGPFQKERWCPSGQRGTLVVESSRVPQFHDFVDPTHLIAPCFTLKRNNRLGADVPLVANFACRHLTFGQQS